MPQGRQESTPTEKALLFRGQRGRREKRASLRGWAGREGLVEI